MKRENRYKPYKFKQPIWKNLDIAQRHPLFSQANRQNAGEQNAELNVAVVCSPKQLKRRQAALALAFLTPLSSLVSNGQKLQLVHSHIERISDVIKVKREQQVQYAQYPPRLAGQIRLEHVHFRYACHAPEILHDICVQIEPEQKIAIAGRTGSGKSTLGKLLPGLSLPTEGKILYDGFPLRDLSYPAILLLDEATSSLDVATEQAVKRNLRHLACTQIIIAHRLSTIRSADTILFLNEGRIVERGTHQELLRQNGYYTKLIQSQFDQ